MLIKLQQKFDLRYLQKRIIENVTKKLKFGIGKAVIINSPADLQSAFEKLHYNFEFDKKATSKCSLIFVSHSKSLYSFLNQIFVVI